MDFVLLSKRVNTYRTPSGIITGVPDDVLGDILKAWEQWSGTGLEFAKKLGVTRRQSVILIEKAKERIRQGVALKPVSEFQEISINDALAQPAKETTTIEVVWDKGRLIRFSQVQHLVEFIKAVA